MRWKHLLLAGAVMTAACVYPSSTVVQGGTESALSFGTLPATAVISIDGQVVGTAADFSGKVLSVSPGTHRIVVTQGGATLVSRDYYVGRQSTVSVEVN